MGRYSTSLASYSDCRQVFDTVLTRGPLTITFENQSKAAEFAGRATKYRVMIRAHNEAQGVGALSPWDHLMVRRLGNGVVRVEPRGFTAIAILDDSGETVELSKSTAAHLAPPPIPPAQGTAPTTPVESEMERFFAEMTETGLGLTRKGNEDA